MCLTKASSNDVQYFFSMQVDESILPGSKCLILVCVRLIKNNSVYEELAFSDLMETNSKGRLVFEKIVRYFEVNNIPSKHHIRIATYGTPSMIGKYRGFIKYFKDLNPDILTIHRYTSQTFSCKTFVLLFK